MLHHAKRGHQHRFSFTVLQAGLAGQVLPGEGLPVRMLEATDHPECGEKNSSERAVLGYRAGFSSSHYLPHR